MALLDGAGELQQPVRERGLAVVYVGDDGEVPDPLRRVQRQLGPGHRATRAVLRRRLRRQEALGLLERAAREGGGSGEVPGNPASGSPERGRAGHSEPRAAAGARVLGGFGRSQMGGVEPVYGLGPCGC